jgi:hypothetical protein
MGYVMTKLGPKKIKCLHCGNKRLDSMNGYCEKCLSLSCGDSDEILALKGRRRCIVKDCQNYTDQGLFVGDLCMPCHRFVTVGEGAHSQIFRNGLGFFTTRLARHLMMVLDPTYQLPSKADLELARLVRG